MNPEALRALLREATTIAIVGLSPKPWRASHQVARYLQEAGYRIVPVNPEHEAVLGERSYPSLTAAAAAGSIDVVDVFRRSEFAGAIVDEAIAVQPPGRQLFELIGRTHPRHGRLTVHLEPHGPLLDHGRVGEHPAPPGAGGVRWR